MFVVSVKVKTLRMAVVVLALGVIIAVAFWPGGLAISAPAISTNNKYIGITSNDKRVKFLESFGWKVDPEPLEVVEVTIPRSFNAVYNNYNAIQRNQGLDLRDYRGKRVKRWTYRITNYPGVTDEVRANLLIYNDRIIGGDVSTVALSGFMHGFSMDGTGNAATGITPSSANITEGIFATP